MTSPINPQPDSEREARPVATRYPGLQPPAGWPSPETVETQGLAYDAAIDTWYNPKEFDRIVHLSTVED